MIERCKHFMNGRQIPCRQCVHINPGLNIYSSEGSFLDVGNSGKNGAGHDRQS